MNWTSQHIDKQFRLIFDSEVWMVGLLLMGFVVLLGVNQAAGLIGMVVFCYFIQQIVNKNPKGYVIHYLSDLGIVSLFHKKRKYRI